MPADGVFDWRSTPKDPLLKSGRERQRELFQKMAQFGNGYQNEDIIGAAANLVINALRQSHATRDKAEEAFDKYFNRTKDLLMEHYHGTGRKKGIFPYNQTIVTPFLDFRSMQE